MSIEEYIRILKAHVEAQQPDFGDGESVLTLLYEAYNEVNTMDDAKIKADFHKLYELMNGMPLRDMDKIIIQFALSAGVTNAPASPTESRLASGWQLRQD